ncbi:hypothetical protein [Hallella sp.]|uniref:hypothetical protein n=1 Tax=Hallella sp. TaxID=2980186 RepID=UPI00307B0241
MINRREKDEHLDEASKRRLQLIRYKLEDKCYIVHENDKVIRELHQYFEQHGGTYERLQCLYYMGSTYRDMGDYTSSIVWYSKAAQFAETNPLSRNDSIILSFVYSQISDLFYKINNGKEALQSQLKSMEVQRKLGIDNYYTYEDVARTADGANDTSMASKFYRKALTDMVNEGVAEERLNLLGEQLGFYASHNMKQQADFVYSLIRDSKQHPVPPNAYASIAIYFNSKQKADSALKYSIIAFECEDRNSAKRELAQNIAKLSALLGDRQKAYHYSMLSMDLSDSVQKEMDAQNVLIAKTQRVIKELQEARDIKKESAQRRKTNLLIGSVGILLVIAIISLLLIFNYRRKLRIQMKLEQIESEKEKISTDHISLLEKVQADRRLRARSAKDVSSVKSHLANLADNPKDKLQPDMWEVVFDAVDTTYPDLRQRLLTYNQDLENKDLILLYLMKLEFKQADVARIMKRAPSVISRKYHRIETMLGVPIKTALNPNRS